ncbi:MAG: DUF935 domain-containing protein [Paracoccus sp. (in: a-proteobacteria)]|uniref:DUF935 domain-containing protein n=1 Tax=Paracoccus sp. TaxID=267 RepID=UPI0026DF55D9|nr:DUF935 domain-containing protein [Paracoccus sp. (in: a-proteobacteria)]MDO5631126.1 DUF935 domain-containing protein [Paracoccus sp. (in: a-proteobacteria)]
MVKRESRVLGPDGRPVEMQALTDSVMPPSTTGVRQAWANSIASGLTPEKLAAILKAANGGDNRDLLTLAEEMEERDTHYASVLGQRKRAVSGIEPIVRAGGTDAKAKAAAVAVQELVAAPIFDDMIDNLLDALAKGYAVVQPIWNYGAVWKPAEYRFEDPRAFQFAGDDLRIRDAEIREGRPIPPWSLIVHRPHLKSGLTVRAGLARLVAWTFMLKSYTLQDWAAFLEIFGMPLRVGKYDRGASAEERRVLLRAVRDLATDAAAIIPMGMEIEFIEAKGGSGNAVFGAMAEYLDKQVSKAVIGQTMTTDEGSSRSQSEIHDEVRLDIRRADAKQLGTTVNRDLIAPFIAFNFGPDVAAPVVSWPVEDPEDVKEFTEAVARVVPLGQPVAVVDVAAKMGIRVPEAGDAILRVPGTLVADAPAHVARQIAGCCPGCGTTHRASATPPPEDDPLVAEALAEWHLDMAPIIDPILQALDEVQAAGGGYDEFLARLDQMQPDTSALARRLAILTMKARGDGDLGR